MNLSDKIYWQLKQRCTTAYKIAYCLFIKKINVQGIFLPVKNWYSNRVFTFILSGEYEHSEMTIIKKKLAATDKVVEFGSGLGLLSAYCATIAGNERVHTFEGNLQLENVIRETYSLNGVNPGIIFGLVGKEAKQVSFNVEPKDIWASSIVNKTATSKLVHINQLKANDIIEEHQPTFLIIDIEGAEEDLLPTLNLSKVNKLQIEFHPLVYGDETMKKLMEIIESRGFVKENDDDPQSFYFYRPV